MVCAILLPLMFDEPEEDPTERASDPADKAREKTDEFRMHAELAAVFEACRKFDAQLMPGLDAEVARNIQRTIARLDKSKTPNSPVLPQESITGAATILNSPATLSLSTNDYHLYRRPGEVMIVRWLAGDEVEQFYQRLQAHFDAAMNGYRSEQHTDLEWKQDPESLAYLAALDAVEVKMAERYLRPMIREHGLFVLNTQSADEINIAYLTDYVMGVTTADLVGTKSAPPDEPTEQDLAWFYKLFSLRGMHNGIEQMCFFTYLQKSDEDSF